MRDIIITLQAASRCITDAITAIEGIGYAPVPGAEGYEYNGMQIRHKVIGGWRPIRLNQSRFTVKGKEWYVPAGGGVPRVCGEKNFKNETK